ncbi:MAG: hypothetical protein HQ481_07310 [Alphaproteobacteria bacterium]|nr:hypothetical protein [Alphaproteobacteria bacterium]
MFFLVFSGFASTSSRRANVSTPERRAQAGTVRSESATRSCAGLNGRLSTLPAGLWQGPEAVGKAPIPALTPAPTLASIVVMALVMSLGVGAARANDSLVSRITERLCYPPSAETMTLSSEEIAIYARSGRLTGAYRDIQGSDARAWFEKSTAGALCRTPATGDMALFFCATVTRDGLVLVRGPRRLCS